MVFVAATVSGFASVVVCASPFFLKAALNLALRLSRAPRAMFRERASAMCWLVKRSEGRTAEA